MKSLTLKRLSHNDDGTFGVLLRDNMPMCLTLEEGWRDNRPNVSAIPSGVYQCEITNSPKFGRVYKIKNVPGRSHILIHWGNTEKDIKGCILVGEKLGTLMARDDQSGRTEKQLAVLSSRVAFKRFMKAMGGEPFLLLVCWS